jgi:hypothetical protein
LQRHFRQTMRETARSPFIDPTELPSFVRISEAAPLKAVGFVFDEASSILSDNMDSRSGGETNLATVPMYNTPLNFQSLGVACMRGGTERLSFMPSSSSELPGESMFSNSTERGFEEVDLTGVDNKACFRAMRFLKTIPKCTAPLVRAVLHPVTISGAWKNWDCPPAGE